MSNDFVLLKLEKPSKFKSVKLAAADGSAIKVGEWATASGWGRTNEYGTTSYGLQHVKLRLISNEECSRAIKSDETLVKESADVDDVLLGLVSWGDTCVRDGTPTAFAIVSRVRAWIESITSVL
ncbi:hypothetical protein JG687_00012532 [Phytophthora cactorum]|uniref:Peptidase S1 domain-containing protein n=1 Tax=Phytophthora cactorum TaxID=29920 RepID=A0A8T1U409_9STRA|nr:hypothetical protein JG687_00012532 [Phytophthora cactorum]